jgi:hypothetical protein
LWEKDIQVLEGAALDAHMMAMHGWNAGMVEGRGALTWAQKQYGYTSGWHSSVHGRGGAPQ